MLTFNCRCSVCGREYSFNPSLMLCPDCAADQEPERPLKGILEFFPSGQAVTGWGPLDLLPVERKWFPSVPVGNTPLWAPEGLRKETGFKGLFIKDDSLNPSGSLKDRASFLVAAYARREGIKRVVLASTGNAGSSMAGIGAAAGLDVRLFLPASAPQAKLIQALQYGADLVRVDGTYDRAYDMALAEADDPDVLSRNTAHNPLTIEGKKTVSLEIFRQLGDSVPDYIFVSAGDGVILSGVYRGFEDLLALGISDRMPVLAAVQAEGSSAIHRALVSGGFDAPVASTTIADSISVDVPRGGLFALERLIRHNGITVKVSDDEILDAQGVLASGAGLFAEPAAAAAWAGFHQLIPEIDSDAVVVVLVTGSGLKDIEGARKGLTQRGRI